MRAAFFHDHVFGRDTKGIHYTYGSLPYPVLARYGRHFETLVVVGRVRDADASARTVADGRGIEMACLERASRYSMVLGRGAPLRHVRAVLDGVDCAIIRLPSAIGEIARREAVRTGKPWMAEVVGCPWDALWNHGSLAGKLLAPRTYVLTRRAVASAPYALYVTQGFLQRRYPCRGETMACSDVSVEAPRQDVLERRLARVQGGREGRPAVLGLVGSLDVKYKGHETALRAVSLLSGAGIDVRLRCIGGGDASPWRRRAAELGIADRVELMGTLPHGPAVLEWMDGLDLFLIPSLQEGLPRALVEAMSRAVPAVGARTGGIPELIGPEHLHPASDHRCLAERIGRLLRRPDEMKLCARRNWEVARGFSGDVLDARRSGFLARFRSFAESSTRRPRTAPAAARA
jgi:glycosyltransferase involved in cell wall biosynthesis